MLHDLEYRGLILVIGRLEEKLFEMLLQCQVDKRVERILAALLRDFRDRSVWRLHPVVEKDPVVVGGSRFGSDGTIGLTLLFRRRLLQFAPHLAALLPVPRAAGCGSRAIPAVCRMACYSRK